MSSDYYGSQAGEIADQGWPCCEHCDHDPGFHHNDKCETCHE